MLIFMYLLFAVKPYSLVIFVTLAIILVFFTILQAIFKPYKSKWNNGLDCWLMINLACLYITLSNQYLRSGPLPIIILFLYTLAFAVNCYYNSCFFSLKKFKKIKQRFSIFQSKVLASWSMKNSADTRLNKNKCVQDTYYQSCNAYREPLISPTGYHH